MKRAFGTLARDLQQRARRINPNHIKSGIHQRFCQDSRTATNIENPSDREPGISKTTEYLRRSLNRRTFEGCCLDIGKIGLIERLHGDDSRHPGEPFAILN